MRIQSTVIGLFCALACCAAHCSCAQEKGLPPDVKRVVFLGDSITHAGGYIDAIETALIVQYPERHIELLNLGLPSETTSGLSEPGHAGGQFPRPDLHERFILIISYFYNKFFPILKLNHCFRHLRHTKYKLSF